MRHALQIGLGWGCLALYIFAAEPPVDKTELPRIPPKEPAAALAAFEIKPGFKIELVASEPLIVDPVAFAFDENGFLFVVEMRGYSERREEALGRVKRLEDTDGDGRYDRATVYVDKLKWPTGLACHDGGVFICASPDIMYCKDTDGDGRADQREVVFTGFGKGRSRLNVQALVNGLKWGPDNRIYGATAGNGGVVTKVGSDDKPLNLSRKDFSFDPIDRTLRAESGTAQFGLAFDASGRRYVCSNSRHIQTIMYAPRYAGRNPFFSLPSPLVDIPKDGAAAEVYRISPDEPWRIVRTRWRVAGLVRGPVEGGGRVSGYFTAATGIAVYTGAVFPASHRDDAFIGDAGSNLIHHKKLNRGGVQPLAERPGDELKREFLVSSDNWFRPVFLDNGPDGALYVADFYREVIEHPWSLPQSIKQHLDLNHGNDRGRIYRILPADFKPSKPVELGRLSAREWVAALEHANGWHRETASRLLATRQPNEAIGPLKKSPAYQALYVLQNMNGLSDERLQKALRSNDPLVRLHAVRLSEKRPGIDFAGLSRDPSVHVRFQVALSLGFSESKSRLPALQELLANAKGDAWIQNAVLGSLTHPADAAELLDGSNEKMMGRLAEMVGRSKQGAAVERVLAVVQKMEKPAQRSLVWSQLGKGLKAAGGSLQQVAGKALEDEVILAEKTIRDRSAEPGLRIQAIRLLGLIDDTKLLPLLDAREPQAIQLAALQAIGVKQGDHLLARLKTLTPIVREAVVRKMLGTIEATKRLLQAQEKGEVDSMFTAAQVKMLLVHPDKRIKAQAKKLFQASTAASKIELRAKFEPALKKVGDVKRGGMVFAKLCASCHRSGKEGHAVGPDRESFKQAGRETILTAVLEPNREIAPQYAAYILTERSGATHYGVIVDESARAITIRQPLGIESVVSRSAIKELKSLDSSLMPDALAAGITLSEMVDLLTFLER